MLMMTFGPISVLALAGLLSAVASLFTVAQQQAPEDPVEDLTFRLRKPWQWRAAHPVRAIQRLLR